MIYEETVVLTGAFDDAVAAVKEALAAEGFGTLTEIDLQATFRAKIDHEIDPYVIIGACNPQLASRALAVEPQMGVLLPCNVVVRRGADGDIVVEAADPGLMATITGNDEVEAVAEEARQRINRALARLMAS